MISTVCDVCMKPIPAMQGGKAIDFGHTGTNARVEADLCSKHYLEFKAMRKKWFSEARKVAQGFMP